MRRIILIGLLLLSSYRVEAANDGNTAYYATPAITNVLTWSGTNTAGNVAIIGCLASSDSGGIDSATWNGDGATYIRDVTMPDGSLIKAYLLLSPDTGSHSAVCNSQTSAFNKGGVIAFYTNNSLTQPDSSNEGTNSGSVGVSITVPITTVAENTTVILIAVDSEYSTGVHGCSGSNLEGSPNYIALLDKDLVASGSNSACADDTPHVPYWGGIVIALAPDSSHTYTPADYSELNTDLGLAVCGDFIHLHAPDNYTGNLELPDDKGCTTTPIKIRTTPSILLPIDGVRIDPSDATHLAKLVGTTGSVLTIPLNSDGWDISELQFVPTGDNTGPMVLTGYEPTVKADVPVDLHFRHILIDVPIDQLQQTAFLMNAGDSWIKDSYIDGIKHTGAEGQCFNSTNSTVNILIQNNYLRCAGENSMIGGGDPIDDNVLDGFEFTENYVAKDLRWNPGCVGATNPLCNGIPWNGVTYIVKNLFEFKFIKNANVHGNIFEYNWTGEQAGNPIVFTPRNQGAGCEECVVEDVAFHDNIIRYAGKPFNITFGDNIFPSEPTKRVYMYNNLWYGLGDFWNGNLGNVRISYSQAQDGATDFSFSHNTIANANVSESAAMMISMSGLDPIPNFHIDDNMMVRNDDGAGFNGGIRSEDPCGGAGGDEGSVSLACLQGSGSSFLKNVIASAVDGSALYPATTFAMPTVTYYLSQFENPATGDYRVKTTSIYYHQGTGGLTPGVDMCNGTFPDPNGDGKSIFDCGLVASPKIFRMLKESYKERDLRAN